MIIPLDELINYKANRYELTCAAIKRAIQINLTNDEDLEKNNKKIVPTALRQLLMKKVQFKMEE